MAAVRERKTEPVMSMATGRKFKTKTLGDVLRGVANSNVSEDKKIH